MSADDLFMQTDSLRSFAQTHDDVAAGLSALIGSHVTAAGVELTHGTIASSVYAALTGALEARQDAHQTAAGVGNDLSQALRKAVHAYEGVDDRSAAAVGSASERFDSRGAVSPGSQVPTPAGASSAGVGAGAGSTSAAHGGARQ